MAIKKSELLLAVCRIVSGIQIDGDTAGTAMQPLSVALDDAVGKSLAHAKQFFAIHTIFKAREGRLRSEIFSFHRIPTHQEFVHRERRRSRFATEPLERQSTPLKSSHLDKSHT